MTRQDFPLPPCHGIIPARWASTRFPGKPLADINGRPMIWHVHARASQCTLLTNVTVATDDRRIAEAAAKYGIECIMTARDHESGTDRVKEAADAMGLSGDCIVINIQGDEPLLDPTMLYKLLEPFENNDIEATTLVYEIDEASAANPDRVKAVFGVDGNALYFSRSPIPHYRERTSQPVYYGHIGLYAFRKSTLDRFVSLPAGRLESIEKLEQLRLLENGIPLHVRVVDSGNIGVDRPEDLDAVLSVMERNSL